MPPPPGPAPTLRRKGITTRGLLLLWLHLTVYAVVVGVLSFVFVFSGAYHQPTIDTFNAVFWPSFVWGTLIAVQAGVTLFPRRPFMGAVTGAMGSVALGGWLLDLVPGYHVVAVVFWSMSAGLSAVAVLLSVLRRPPSFLAVVTPVAEAAPGQALAARPARRPSLVSLPNLALGAFAAIVVLSAVGSSLLSSFDVRGSGKFASAATTVAPFTTVSTIGIDVVRVEPGSTPGVVIGGDDNLLAYVDVTVTSGHLAVRFDPGLPTEVRTGAPLEATVTMPTAGEVTTSGADQVFVSGFRDGDLRLSVDGATRAVVTDVRLGSMGLVAAGDASVVADGFAGRTSVDVGGRSVIDLYAWRSDETSVSAWAIASVTLGMPGRLTYRQVAQGSIGYPGGIEIDPGSVAESPGLVFLLGEPADPVRPSR